MTAPLDPIQAATRFLGSGRFEEAESLCMAALSLDPADARALSVLAVSQDRRGRHEQAASLFRRLTRLEPGLALHWANLGTALRGAGAFDEAMAAHQEAARLGLRAPDFLVNTALLHIDRLEYGQARALLQEAAVLAPRSAEIRYFEAVCNYQEVKTEDAQTALIGWRSLEGLTADLLVRVGSLLMQLGQTAESETALREALTREPHHALAGVRLAQLLERTNRVADAQQQISALDMPSAPASELAEDHLAIKARLAERSGDLSAAKVGYQKLLTMAAPLHQRHQVLFPLARVLDELEEYDECMRTLGLAHESQLAFLRKAAARFLDPQRQAFNIANFSCDKADIAEWDHSGAPAASDSPIFVVGFPRSGTTLLEQMLDAHPLLHAMDEQPYLQQAIDHIGRLGVRYPEELAKLSPAQCQEVRAAYWQLARSRAGLKEGQRLVDKNPLNLLRLPAIMRLFPNARIILAVRHPFDVLISNYQQHYRAPEIAVMCRNLESLADGYRRAFDFWFQQQELLSPAALELRYEDLVSDFEGHARRIAEFLHLSWNDVMLKPAEHALKRGYISTPSYSQVVQPVSQKAIGRWRRYESRFQMILPALERYLRRWSY